MARALARCWDAYDQLTEMRLAMTLDFNITSAAAEAEQWHPNHAAQAPERIYLISPDAMRTAVTVVMSIF